MPVLELNVNVTLLIMLINIGFAFIIVFLERRNPTATWTWLFVLMFMPIVGFFLYLFIGQDMRKKKLFAKKEEVDLKSIAEQQTALIKSRKLDEIKPVAQRHSDIIQLQLRNSQSVYTQNNRVTMLNNGDEKFPALFKAIREAKDHVHLEYYIIRDDHLGRSLQKLLIKKAKEGVEVRLLYDGMGCIRVSRKYFAELKKAGVQVAEFYPPILPYINFRINYRNHRKIAIIDGMKAFTGGLNIGDEYMGLVEKHGFWRDTHSMLEGEAVDYFQMRFMVDWHFAYGERLPFDERYFPPKPIVGDTGVQVVSSGPDSTWAAVHQGYFKMITKAKKNVYLQTPYLIPDDSILEALKIAALGGVDVKIIIPCKPDHPFVYWASTSYAGELIEAGVKIYTYDNGFLHSKLLMVDGEIVSVGSANMDIRSFKLSFELNAFIYDENVAKEFEQSFIRDLDCSTLITSELYAQRSGWIKFKESISRLLSPIL